ncbi:hypothetical protein KIN20_010914 [Parelaphostrongylus tenuis]|uniref:Uncharacterized protein n=1 Tax=Parelaphostrongylus tenuis TaxID=148309 RepID=A0AAD5MR94_PARTN|nr:hypothetical protein KIN20_010914 [Parelaphostrongylus tenuis]
MGTMNPNTLTLVTLVALVKILQNESPVYDARDAADIAMDVMEDTEYPKTRQ